MLAEKSFLIMQNLEIYIEIQSMKIEEYSRLVGDTRTTTTMSLQFNAAVLQFDIKLTTT